MKVMHVVSAFVGGGAEKLIFNLIRNGFYRSGELRVVFLVRGSGQGEDEFARLLGPGNFKILLDRADAGIKHVPWLLWQLMREFRDYAPDVAVLSLTPAILLGRLAKLAHPKTRIVSFEHSINDRWGLPIRWALWLTSFVNDAVFGDTPATLEAIPARYARRQPAYEVPPMIAGHAAGPASPKKSSVFKLTSVGRLTPQKNYPALVQAVKTLGDEGMPVELTIAGEGRQRPELEKLIEALDLAAQVHLLGHVAGAEALSDIRRQAHIYVQPSLYEGLCLACLEAMADGQVVVASDVGGMQDYGRDGENMIKIKGFDADAIAAALRRTIKGYDEFCRVLPPAAIKAAQKQFQAAVVEQKWREAAGALAGLAAGKVL